MREGGSCGKSKSTMWLVLARHTLRFLLLLLIPLGSVRAERYQFFLQHPSATLEDGVVCFFHGESGSFASQYFVSNEIRCVPSGELITIPPGGWNVYATHERGFFSTNPDLLIVSPALPPENVYRIAMSMIATGSGRARPERLLETRGASGPVHCER
jgi:hypothetical protein